MFQVKGQENYVLIPLAALAIDYPDYCEIGVQFLDDSEMP
jgi:hypothetical protein